MSKRKRIKAEDKIRIAKACITGTISLNSAADRLGVYGCQGTSDHSKEGPLTLFAVE